MTRLTTLLVGILGAVICLWLGVHLCRESPEAPTMQVLTRLRGPVYVIAVDPVSDRSLQAFTEAVSQVMPLEVRRSDKWRIDERQQLSWDGDVYDVDHLLDVMVQTVPRDARVIGVTDQPMHDEEHWWLYGKAAGVSIVSTAHLWRDEWSPERDTNDPLFRSRLAKVGVHEFGHGVGFQHCDDAKCAMYFATELWMLDATESEICRKCIEGWLSWNGIVDE